MASSADLRIVRENVNELDDSVYSDEYIEALIDSSGVEAASATIWTRKAAAYSELVDQSEAGASVKFSDLSKNALRMAEKFEAQVLAATVGDSNTRAKVHQIQRLT